MLTKQTTASRRSFLHVRSSVLKCDVSDGT